jgi:hypothetical protein
VAPDFLGMNKVFRMGLRKISLEVSLANHFRKVRLDKRVAQKLLGEEQDELWEAKMP